MDRRAAAAAAAADSKAVLVALVAAPVTAVPDRREWPGVTTKAELGEAWGRRGPHREEESDQQLTAADTVKEDDRSIR